MEMKQKSEQIITSKLLTYVLLGFEAVLGMFGMYYGSTSAPGLRRSDDDASGFDVSYPVLGGFARNRDSDDLLEDQELNPEGPKGIPICDIKYSELIPCLDRNLIWQIYLIRALLKRNQISTGFIVNCEKINFPGGGTHFHDGADKYIVAVARILKFPGDKINNDGNIKNVLDVGCGCKFWSLPLSHDILAMSLAPNDVHESQMQFALERRIPLTLGVLVKKRLPYASRPFELAHCLRCRIDCLQRDGILLLELDRLLRPGGFSAYWSGVAGGTASGKKTVCSVIISELCDQHVVL